MYAVHVCTFCVIKVLPSLALASLYLRLVMQRQNPECKITESDVHNAPEPDTNSVSFLTRHHLRGSDVPELHLAEVGLVGAAAPPAAVPALQPPSQASLGNANPALSAQPSSDSVI